jgi:hypothetical protein
MQSFWSQWPILPLPPRDAQARARWRLLRCVPVEVPAPVLEPLAAPRTACSRCGAPLPANSGPGRPRSLCDDCRGQKRNGHDPKPLADLKERPMRAQSYEAEWLAEQLRPPRLPWES